MKILLMTKKLFSKFKNSMYLFKKAEILHNIVDKEINGEYDNLCHQCYFNGQSEEIAVLIDESIDPTQVKIALYLGGALGDYIVYLRFVDEIAAIGNCKVDLYLDRIGFAEYVFGKRPNVNICHDIHNNLFVNNCSKYDIALHLDHGVTVKHTNLSAIKAKSKAYYVTTCKILEYCKANQLDIGGQHERQLVIFKRAKFTGDTKWSKLSCGGAINMKDMYSNILLNPKMYGVLQRHDLTEKSYITVNYGADKNMGGTSQTKVLPEKNLEDLIELLKANYPQYKIVQTGTAGSKKLKGVDVYAFDCNLDETAIVLKYSCVHVDSEGGLVHLASQMSTPCVVSFGPTPSYYYGYPRNENIVSELCSDCMSVTGQWNLVCPLMLQAPLCMQSISGNRIFESTRRILDAESQALSGTKQEPTNHIDSLKDLNQQLKNVEKCAPVAMIGAINKDCVEISCHLVKMNHRVTYFVETELTELDDQLLKKLNENGIKIEYGNALNIARQNHSFGLLIYKTEQKNKMLDKFVELEIQRLISTNGKVLEIQGIQN